MPGALDILLCVVIGILCMEVLFLVAVLFGWILKARGSP
jgi:hypothetical protein